MPLLAHIPGSKSLTQRALMVAALADGPLAIKGALPCHDSRVLSDLLRHLGVKVAWTGDHVAVQPAPLIAQGTMVQLENAGTAMRFGACLALLCDGTLAIDGNDRMRQRPIGPLASALTTLGLEVGFPRTPGFPPLHLRRHGPAPHEVEVDVSHSSQFASGLLLVAPQLPLALRLRLKGKLVSRPYLKMTTVLMGQAGAKVHWIDERTILVEPFPYLAATVDEGILQVEPDWSSAAFILAAAWILGHQVQVPGLPDPTHTHQGDSAFAAFLAELDHPHPHQFNLTDCPDLVPPLCAAALFAKAPTQIRGVAHARQKECDRLAVLARELGRTGARIDEEPDGLRIEPFTAPPVLQGDLLLDPANDHRMAMAFALVGLRISGLQVADPGCVGKSFPDFFDVLADLCRQAAGTP